MKIIKPDYFDKFKCKANLCKDSCCSAGWDIDVDNKALSTYCGLKDEFFKDITNYVNTNKNSKTFKQQNGHCVFFKNGLCELVTKYGDKALCDVCRDYPRFYVWAKDVCLQGLSFDCEEVVNLVFGGLNKVQFITNNAKSKDAKNQKQIDLMFDIINLLQDRSQNINKRINNVKNLLNIQKYDFDNTIFNLLDNFEWLNFDGQKLKQFLLCQNLNLEFEYCDEIIENLLIYFVYRYFLNSQYKVSNQAVFKFALFCTICCDRLQNFCDKKSQNYYKYKEITTFCRQIEYSNKNISDLLNYFNENKE